VSPLQNQSLGFIKPTNSSATASEPDDDSSPFHFKDEDVKVPYGSHHQHYLINDKYLIAVGVVDVLPHCLSSVYSFYDPTLSEVLNLGKLTALYEIEWVHNASRFRPELKYYYLGYYIHSCQKMRYKAEFKPSELLCPSREVWVDFEDAKKRLEIRSPIRNCCNISTPDEEYIKGADAHFTMHGSGEKKAVSVDDILFDIGGDSYLTLHMISEEGKEIVRPILEDFVSEIGYEISMQCIVKLC